MSDISTLAILKRRRKALTTISRHRPTASPVLVHDPIVQLPIHGGGTVTDFEGGYLWQRSVPELDDRDCASVWVASNKSNYANIYKAFLTRIYGVTDFACLSRSGPKAERHFVDHVYGRVQLVENYADTKSGSTIPADNQRYHLLEAVPYRANSSGGSMEKKMSRSTILSAYQRKQRLLTWVHIIKLYGLMTPRRKDDTPRYSEAIRVLGEDGWQGSEVRDGLNSLIDLAAFRGAKTATS